MIWWTLRFFSVHLYLASFYIDSMRDWDHPTAPSWTPNSRPYGHNSSQKHSSSMVHEGLLPLQDRLSLLHVHSGIHAHLSSREGLFSVSCRYHVRNSQYPLSFQRDMRPFIIVLSYIQSLGCKMMSSNLWLGLARNRLYLCVIDSPNVSNDSTQDETLLLKYIVFIKDCRSSKLQSKRF